MNNYHKGKNVEEPLERAKIPIPNLPQNFLWMQVRGGSKIRNLLTHALNEFPDVKHVVWTGFGPSVGKAITCSEIMKREWDNKLHQITKICYRMIEEYWDPINSELCQLVVKRKLPMIHIYLSTERLNEEELGYQAPGKLVPYNVRSEKVPNKKPVPNKPTKKPTLQDFVSQKLNKNPSPGTKKKGGSKKTDKHKLKTNLDAKSDPVETEVHGIVSEEDGMNSSKDSNKFQEEEGLVHNKVAKVSGKSQNQGGSR